MANTSRGRLRRRPDDDRQTHRKLRRQAHRGGPPMKPSRLLTFGGGDVTPSRPGGWTRPMPPDIGHRARRRGRRTTWLRKSSSLMTSTAPKVRHHHASVQSRFRLLRDRPAPAESAEPANGAGALRVGGASGARREPAQTEAWTAPAEQLGVGLPAPPAAADGYTARAGQLVVGLPTRETASDSALGSRQRLRRGRPGVFFHEVLAAYREASEEPKAAR